MEIVVSTILCLWLPAKMPTEETEVDRASAHSGAGGGAVCPGDLVFRWATQSCSADSSRV